MVQWRRKAAKNWQWDMVKVIPMNQEGGTQVTGQVISRFGVSGKVSSSGR